MLALLSSSFRNSTHHRLPSVLPHQRWQSEGLTLVELIIVTVILGLLAIVATPTIHAYFERVRVTKGMSIGNAVQAALMASTTTSANNTYPSAMPTYGELVTLVNANGALLKETEVAMGLELRAHTPLDSDSDGLYERYTMSFTVTNVSPTRRGWCIIVQPSGVEPCPPE